MLLKKVRPKPLALWEQVRNGKDIGCDTSLDKICLTCWNDGYYTCTPSGYCPEHGEVVTLPEWAVGYSKFRDEYEQKLINRRKKVKYDFAALQAPFPVGDIKFRAGTGSEANSSVQVLAYIDSRIVMERLDEVIGVGNWKDDFKEGPGGGQLCGIGIWDSDKGEHGEWVFRWDGADNTAVEGVKGGLSDSFKRAAVKWGIGRYLYDLPMVWVDAKIVQRGQGKKPAFYIKDPNEPLKKYLPHLTPHLRFSGDKLNAAALKSMEKQISDNGQDTTALMQRVFGADCSKEHMTTVSARNLVNLSGMLKGVKEPYIKVQMEQDCAYFTRRGEIYEPNPTE